MKRLNRWKYILLAFAIITMYLLIRVTNWNLNDRWIENTMLATLLMIVVGNIVLLYRKRWSSQCLLVSILLAGCVMRIGYMLYTGCEVRSHDIFEFSSDSYGHAAYLLKLIEKNQLPETNMIQFYQQPFFYLVGAGVSKIVNGLLRSESPYNYVDAAKLVSCFASCATIFVTERLCEILNIREKGKVIAVAIVAFLPSFYLIGGRVNCDAFALYFMALAIYYTILWTKDMSWKNTILLAVIYGLGVMTKIPALATAGVFLWKFIIEIRKKKGWALLIKYFVFGGISLPLGLWYSLRNYHLFGQKLSYVLMQDENSTLYCGNHSYVQRFLSVGIKNLIETPYAEPFGDYNFTTYLVKSALFGEFKYAVSDLFPILLLIAGLMIAGLFLCAYYWQGKRIIMGKSDSAMALLAMNGLIFIGSAIAFCIKYAFGCNMDFRHYGIFAVICAVLLGDMLDQSQSEEMKSFGSGAVILFGITSCCMYIMV